MKLIEKLTESHFILGIDIGNSSSAIAYFDAFRKAPEIIDLSGGYGKPAAPTVVQYIPETGEWVFGEYAVLNANVGGREITLQNLPEKLGMKTSVMIGGKSYGIPGLLALYIADLVANCKNLNPKAVIAGIVVCVPEFMPENALDELRLAFRLSGCDNDKVEFISETQCVFRNFFYRKKPVSETVALLDYGNRELRGGVYEISPEDGGVKIIAAALLNDSGLSVGKIDKNTSDFFSSLYYGERPGPAKKTVEGQIASFSYQHKDLLFQKNIRSKPIKLYFNFAYPPFFLTVRAASAENLSRPFETGFEKFIYALLGNALDQSAKPYRPHQINSVIACGGGFDMLWAKESLKKIFPDAVVHLYKNQKCAAAEGASIIAAEKLGVYEPVKMIAEDNLKLEYDFGFAVKKDGSQKFHPLVEKNSYWWQDKYVSGFIVNEKIRGELNLEIIRRDKNGSLSPFGNFSLKGLPERPKGTTRLDIIVHFLNVGKISVKIKDAGFGQLFPASGYESEFVMDL